MALDEMAIRLPISEIEQMKMVNGNVLIEVFDLRGEVNGIKLPITEDNPFLPDRGIVTCVSDNVCFNVGDYVIIEKYKGRRVYSSDLDGRQFILLNESYVVAKLDLSESELLSDPIMNIYSKRKEK